MYEIILIFHVLISIMLITLILIQQGKGAQTGASFGSGASQTVFGSQGSGGFISRTTAVLAAVFLILNLFLAYYINKMSHREVVLPVGQIPIEEKIIPQQDDKTNKGPSVAPSPSGKDVPDVP